MATFTRTLRPIAAGTTTGITTQFPATGSHYDKVDEAVADAYTTYVQENGSAFTVDTYTLTALPTNGRGTINSVKVYATGLDGGPGGQLKCAVYVNSTLYYGSTETLTSSWVAYTKTWATSPATGVAWTWAELDALEAGVALSDTVIGSALCTQVYVEVNHDSQAFTANVGTVTVTATFPGGGAASLSPNRTITYLRSPTYGLTGATVTAVSTLEATEDLDQYLCIGSQDAGSVMTKYPLGTTWTDCVVNTSGVAQPAAYLQTFQNRLAGLGYSLSGFNYSGVGDITTAANWSLATNQYPNVPERFHGLFVGKDADDNEALYALTPSGLRYLDVYSNFTHGLTEVRWEYDKKAGRAGMFFKGDHYIGVNKGVYKFGQGVVTYVGPDQDDGLDSDLQGYVAAMIGIGPWIIIAINGQTSKKSCILKRYLTGQHWHPVRITSAVNTPIHSLCWNSDTLYWGEGTNVKSCPFSNSTDNVKLDVAHTYEASGSIYYPWFDGGFKAMPKVAHKVRITAEGLSTTETSTLLYRTDNNTAWTTLGAFNSGYTPTALSFGSNAIGVQFERIQLRQDLVRGATTTNSPKIKSLVLEYRVVPPVLWGWSFKAACNSKGEKRGQDYITALETALDTTTLLEFWPTGNQSDTAKYVEIVGIPAVQHGGEFGEEGTYMVVVQEATD